MRRQARSPGIGFVVEGSRRIVSRRVVRERLSTCVGISPRRSTRPQARRPAPDHCCMTGSMSGRSSIATATQPCWSANSLRTPSSTGRDRSRSSSRLRTERWRSGCSMPTPSRRLIAKTPAKWHHAPSGSPRTGEGCGSSMRSPTSGVSSNAVWVSRSGSGSMWNETGPIVAPARATGRTSRASYASDRAQRQSQCRLRGTSRQSRGKQVERSRHVVDVAPANG